MKFLMDFFNFIKSQEKKYNVLNLSAQLSYRVLLAFIPFMMLLYNFLNWFSTKLNGDMISGLKLMFPKFTDEFISTASANAAGPQTSHWANIVFGFFILYASVCAVRSLILTVNKVMGIPEKRHYLTIWALSILYLIILVILIVMILYLYVSTQHFITAFFTYLHWSDYFIHFWKGFSLLYIIAICVLLLTGIYMFIPPVHQSFFSALPGAVFVGFGWFSVLGIYDVFIWSKLDFSSFLTSFEGPFLAIIFVYFFCIVFCFGCVVNLFFVKRSELKNEK